MPLLSWIQPSGTIRLLKGVPLDPTYDHTIIFPNTTCQTAYFQSNVFNNGTYTNQYYTRVNSGVIRVQDNIDSIYNTNYLMFKNSLTTDGNKWYYAFVKSVEYINNNVVEIKYEIDVMQTWMFNYTLNTCFVEREHSSSDGLFENIVEENLDFGSEYVYIDRDSFNLGMEEIVGETHTTYRMGLILLANRNNHVGQESDAVGYRINSLVMPLYYQFVNDIDINNISGILDAWDEYADEIVAIYEYPSFLGTPNAPNLETVYTGDYYKTQKYITGGYHDGSLVTPTINGYAPKNKKLFCYPYNYMEVNNNCGDRVNLRYEDWRIYANTAIPKFKIIGSFFTMPSACAYPYGYQGIDDALIFGIRYDNFPNCAWSGDAFKAWWAQNKNTFTTSFATGVLSSATSAVTGAIAGGIAGGPVGAAVGAGVNTGISLASTILGNMARYQDAQAAPNHVKGDAQGESLNAFNNKMRFDFFYVQIKAQYARIIDDYFSRFGYACKRNKIPNTNVREHWTYTKTMGCTLTGEQMPSSVSKAICDIYNNGITFWRANVVGATTNPSSVTCDVGNYSQSNNPSNGW